jgi:L-aminopeptidase/D-esterase-like protein
VASDGGVTVGALMAVNALGDVVDERGTLLAGSSAPPDVVRFPSAAPPAAPHAPLGDDSRGLELESTVIGCLVTDARLSKHEAARAADLAHSGIARSVTPAHTTYDGDALFLLCAQRVEAGLDLDAHLGSLAVAAAIRAAVRAANQTI